MSRSISWRTRKRTPCTTQWSCSLLLTTLRSDRSVFPSGRLMSFSSLIRGGGKDNFRCFSSCFEGGLKGGGDFVSYLLSKSSLSILPRLDYKLFLLFFYLNVLHLKLSILKWNTIGCMHWNVFIDPVCVCCFTGHVCGVWELWPGSWGETIILFPVWTVLPSILCQHQGETTRSPTYHILE